MPNLTTQQRLGSVSTPDSRRKGKNRRKVRPIISAHTRRFRVLYAFDPAKGMKVPVGESWGKVMRSMASVGGPTRRAMKKKLRVDVSRLSALAMLPQWMQTGLAAFNKAAQAFREKHEALKAARYAK